MNRPRSWLLSVLNDIAAWDSDECFLWPGWRDRNGYGMYGTGPRHAAHRLVYQRLVGEIPDGLTIDHVCFTKDCVNPRHLRALSNLENARRQRSALKTRCDHGHEYDQANTYVKPDGHRDCRACNRERVRRYAARKRQAVSA